MPTPDAMAVEARRAQPDAMSMFDLDAFHAKPLQHEPFDYLVVPGFHTRFTNESVCTNCHSTIHGSNFDAAFLK